MSQHVTPKKGGFSSSETRSKIFFLAPALFLVFVLSIFPTVASLFLAISKYGPSGFGGFVWLGNFIDVLGNRHIWETLGTTLTYVFFGVSLQR